MSTRDHTTRRLAENALVRLASTVGPRFLDLTVIGGLNPEYLTTPTASPHQGTVDVDLLLQLGLVYDRDELDLGWLERGLIDAGFHVQDGDQTWRWWIELDGVQVKVELLCDTPDSPDQQLVLPGCRTATAMNLRGPSPAINDAVVRRLDVVGQGRSTEGGATAVEVRFAGLGGYLLAKSAALVQRAEDKDFYDFVFVLIHNMAGGPRAAGSAARAALPDVMLDAHDQVFLAALQQFVDPTSRGPRVFADQRLLDGEAVDVDILVQDAVGAVLECREAFLAGEARVSSEGSSA